MPSTDILNRLREATAARHAVLDAGMPLADPQPTLRDYRDHLLLLRRWLEPIEHWQAGFTDGPQGSDMLPRLPHLELIDADLAHAAMPALWSDDPRAGAWPGLAQPVSEAAPYRWGVAYVIEGSRLGGEVLRRRLAPRLAPHPLLYLGDAHGPGERWLQFLRLLRQEVQEENAIDEACQGAGDAFDRLIEILPSRKSSEKAAILG